VKRTNRPRSGKYRGGNKETLIQDVKTDERPSKIPAEARQLKKTIRRPPGSCPVTAAKGIQSQESSKDPRGRDRKQGCSEGGKEGAASINTEKRD